MMYEGVIKRLKYGYEWIIILTTMIFYSIYRIYTNYEPHSESFGYRVLGISIGALLLTIVLFFALLTIKSGRHLEFVKAKVHMLLKHPYIFLTIYVLIQYIIYIPFSRTSDDVTQLAQTARIIKDNGLIYFFDNYREMPWVGYQHPPLIAVLASLYPEGEGLTNAIATIKLTTVIFSILTVLALFEIAKIYFSPKKALFSALLLANIYLFMKMAVDGRIDSLMTFFTTFTILFFLRATQQGNSRDSLIAGVFAGLGMLIKYTFVLIFPIFFFLCIMDRKRKNWTSLGVILIVSFLVILPWLAFAYSRNILQDHLSAYGTRLSEGWRTDILAYFKNYLRLFQPHLLVITILGIIQLVKSRQFRKPELFFMFWAFFPFIFYSLTTNRLARYTTIAAPGFAIILTLFLTKFTENKNEREKYFIFSLVLGISVIWGNLLIAETLWRCCLRYYTHQLADISSLPLICIMGVLKVITHRVTFYNRRH